MSEVEAVAQTEAVSSSAWSFLLPEDEQTLRYLWSKILSQTTTTTTNEILNLDRICFEWRSLESISLIYEEEAIAAVIATIPLYSLHCYIRDFYARYIQPSTVAVLSAQEYVVRDMLCYHLLALVSLSIHQFHDFSQASLQLQANSSTSASRSHSVSHTNIAGMVQTTTRLPPPPSQQQQRTFSSNNAFNWSTLLSQSATKKEIIETWLQHCPIYEILQLYLSSSSVTKVEESDSDVYLQVKKLALDLSFVIVTESVNFQDMAFGFAYVRSLDITQKHLILLFLYLIESCVVSIPPFYPFMPKELYANLCVPPKNGVDICVKKIRSLFNFSKYHQSVNTATLTAEDSEIIERTGKRHPWKKMLSVVQLLQLVSVVKTRTCLDRPASPPHVASDSTDDEDEATQQAAKQSAAPAASKNIEIPPFTSSRLKEEQVLEVVKTGRFLSFDDDDDRSLSNYSMSGSLNLAPLVNSLPPVRAVKSDRLVSVDRSELDSSSPQVPTSSEAESSTPLNKPASPQPIPTKSTDANKTPAMKSPASEAFSPSTSSSMSQPTPGPANGLVNKDDEMLFTAFEEVFRHIAAVDKALLIKEKQANVNYRNANHCYLCNQYVKGLMEKYFISSTSSSIPQPPPQHPDASPLNTNSASSMYIPANNHSETNNSTSSRRRHHCRICAETICQACSVTSGLNAYYDFQPSDELAVDLEDTGSSNGTNSRKISNNAPSAGPSSRRNSGSARRESLGSIGFLGDNASSNRRESLLGSKDNSKRHSKERACLLCASTIEQFLLPILQTTPSAYSYEEADAIATTKQDNRASGSWFSSSSRRQSGSGAGNAATGEGNGIHDKRVICQCHLCLAVSSNSVEQILPEAFTSWHDRVENLEDISFGGVWKQFKDEEEEGI